MTFAGGDPGGLALFGAEVPAVSDAWRPSGIDCSDLGVATAAAEPRSDDTSELPAQLSRRNPSAMTAKDRSARIGTPPRSGSGLWTRDVAERLSWSATTRAARHVQTIPVEQRLGASSRSLGRSGRSPVRVRGPSVETELVALDVLHHEA